MEIWWCFPIEQPTAHAGAESEFLCKHVFAFCIVKFPSLYIYIYSSLYFKVFFHFLQILSLFLCLSHIHTHSLVFGIYFALDSRSSFSANQLGLSTALFPQVNDSFFFSLLLVWFGKKKSPLWENPLNKIEFFCCFFQPKLPQLV